METNRLSVGEFARHVIDLSGRDSVHAWLEWSEAAELELTVWRDGTPIASSTPIGALTDYLDVDPGRPGPLEFRVTHARGPGPVTYRLRLQEIGTMREVGCKFGRLLDVWLVQRTFPKNDPRAG